MGDAAIPQSQPGKAAAAGLQAARAATGLSQRALGEAAGVSPGTISAVEAGRTPLPLPALQRIAAVVRRVTRDDAIVRAFVETQRYPSWPGVSDQALGDWVMGLDNWFTVSGLARSEWDRSGSERLEDQRRMRRRYGEHMISWQARWSDTAGAREGALGSLSLLKAIATAPGNAGAEWFEQWFQASSEGIRSCRAIALALWRRPGLMLDVLSWEPKAALVPASLIAAALEPEDAAEQEVALKSSGAAEFAREMLPGSDTLPDDRDEPG